MLKLGQFYDKKSRELGYKDWNTFVAELKKQKKNVSFVKDTWKKEFYVVR